MSFRKCLAIALSCLLGVFTLLAPTAATAQTSVTGQWTRLTDLPFGPIHEFLMPDGKVFMWGRDTNQTYLLWDPATQTYTTPTGPGYDQFCAGYAYLADGRVLVAGGHVVDLVGLPQASLFDTKTNTWTRAPDMNAGRWYPTVTTLPNGDALVVSGQIDTTSGVNPLPQVYQAATNTWRSLTNAQLNQDLYPMMFLAPNGKVLNVGPNVTTRYLDTSGTGSWSVLNDRVYGYRDYGSAVMYDAGKIMVMGGGDPPNGTAEIIDLNSPSPTWRFTGYMAQSRRQLNATILPDGTVLATGGTYGSGFNNTTTPVLWAELWDPATELWTKLASQSVGRFYHSSAVLLLDGRVLSVGGDDTKAVEIFSPPYLFKGARPTISTVPSTIGYGQQFSVQSADASGISKVTLIRMPSVTHAFDQNQRMNKLQFTIGSGALNVTAPANANLAPPGLYMLFIVDGTGVPSVAKIVQLGAGGTTPPPPAAPALTSLSPNSATAGGAAFTLTVNGTGFVSGATVNWNGAARTTTFVSATQVTAAIPASDIAVAGTAQVTAINPGSAASNALAFTVSSPPATAPSLTSLSPNSATAGGATFTLTVNGSNFVSGTTVNWNGSPRTTTFLGTTQVSAAIPASDIAAAGTAQVTAINPGSSASNALAFTVTSPPPAQTNTLSVSTTGSAASRGTITSSPAGISCNSSCSAAFATGSVVTLTVKTNGNGVFAGWGGACSGTAATCTVTMDVDKSVTATINRR